MNSPGNPPTVAGRRLSMLVLRLVLLSGALTLTAARGRGAEAGPEPEPKTKTKTKSELSAEWVAKVQPYIEIDTRKEILGRDEFDKWHLEERIGQADSNHDGQLSKAEFAKALKLDARAVEFLSETNFPVSRPRMLELFRKEAAEKATAEWGSVVEPMDRAELDALVSSESARFGQSQGVADSRGVYPRSAVRLKTYADQAAGAEYTKAEAERKEKLGKTLLGFPWDEKKGLILHSSPTSAKDPTPDPKKPQVTFQLLKDFHKAGATRKPASFQWSKDDGEDAVASIAAAARVEYHDPDWGASLDSSLTPAAGVEWTRSGAGAKRVDRLKYLLDMVAEPTVWGVSIGEVHVGPEVEQNLVKNVDYLKGVFEWELNLADLPPFRYFGHWMRHSGVWNRIVPSANPKEFGWYYRPRVGLEPNMVLSEPAGASNPDWVEFNYSVEVGVRLFERVILSYELLHAHQIDDWEASFLMQTATVGIQLDSEERFSVEFNYKRGREAYDDEAMDRWEVGLGVKF